MVCCFLLIALLNTSQRARHCQVDKLFAQQKKLLFFKQMNINCLNCINADFQEKKEMTALKFASCKKNNNYTFFYIYKNQENECKNKFKQCSDDILNKRIDFFNKIKR